MMKLRAIWSLRNGAIDELVNVCGRHSDAGTNADGSCIGCYVEKMTGRLYSPKLPPPKVTAPKGKASA